MEEDMNKGRNIEYNFLTNLNNQSNIVNSDNVSNQQINSVFILVSPYYINEFSIEDINICLKVDEKGDVFLNNERYEAIEVKPGVKIFGILKR